MLLLVSSHRWTNWGAERLSHALRDTQTKDGRDWRVRPFPWRCVTLSLFGVGLAAPHQDLLLLPQLLSVAKIIFYWRVHVMYPPLRTGLLISRSSLMWSAGKEKSGKLPNKRSTWHYNQCQVHGKQAEKCFPNEHIRQEEPVFWLVSCRVTPGILREFAQTHMPETLCLVKKKQKPKKH